MADAADIPSGSGDADHSGEHRGRLFARVDPRIGRHSADLVIEETRMRLDAAGKDLVLLIDEQGVAWIWAERVEPGSTHEGYGDAICRLGSRFYHS